MIFRFRLVIKRRVLRSLRGLISMLFWRVIPGRCCSVEIEFNLLSIRCNKFLRGISEISQMDKEWDICNPISSDNASKHQTP